ncbi:peptidase inhibitor family I36 protein [Actinokineospora sp. G85]|uniref:peptidase inhibitor family I36 protein n=1 Tax=Actinokineospora sp. G85 TaxID=3406626 RepID=UPI003C73C3E1
MGTVGRRLVRASLVVGSSMALVTAVAGTATAATPRNGTCETGEFCLYWGTVYSGSVSDFNGSVPDYGSSQPTCYEFKGPGSGKGTCVKNNAGSARNKTTGHTVRVYYNGGSYTLAAGTSLVLSNRNTSHTFIKN